MSFFALRGSAGRLIAHIDSLTDVEEVLMELALIAKDAETGNISLHRLVQSEVRRPKTIAH